MAPAGRLRAAGPGDPGRPLSQWRACARCRGAGRRLTPYTNIDYRSTACLTTVLRYSRFRSGRHLAAYLSLVSQQHSSGGKARLGAVSKRGDGYL
ncbi:MAG TPA: transposase, partial [Roseiflexaceae bacterium]|nr:transposase [Roseiflexaceae bacterium]